MTHDEAERLITELNAWWWGRTLPEGLTNEHFEAIRVLQEEARNYQELRGVIERGNTVYKSEVAVALWRLIQKLEGTA